MNDDPYTPNLLPISVSLPTLLPALRSSASSAPGSAQPSGPDDRRACPCCGEQQHAVPIRHYQGHTFYIWNICQAMQRGWETSDAKIAQQDASRRQQLAEQALGDPGLARISRFSLASFDPDRMAIELGDDNPLDTVLNWLTAIRPLSIGDYHSGPPVALHLYFAGKGTGKTHLAAGAALTAKAWGKLAVFIEETSYLEHYWAAEFADKERLSMLPGESAWLTVIDDLGQNPPGGDPRGTQKAWYNLINKRWLKCGWTIITSNVTLDQMRSQGTLSDAAYSRLYQMTRDEVIEMRAPDQRLRGAR